MERGDKFDPRLSKDTDIVLIYRKTVMDAELYLAGCETCSDAATLPFDALLDRLTGRHPATEYILERPAKCPFCRHWIYEKTLVECRSDPHRR